MKDKGRIKFIFMVFLLLVIVGTIGYSLLLNTSLIDSLYMTIITISTVGYSEITKMTPWAKIFSIVIIFWGVGIGGYTFTTLVAMIMDGDIKDIWRGKMIENKISKLKDHYILCGAGETGEVIIKQFIENTLDYVVVEKNETVFKNLIDKEILAILGDATEESTLEKAQIKRAKGLICSLPKDGDNIIVVLTARQMNKELYIVSRAIDKNAPSKLKKAGANDIVSSSQIAGRRMATLMIKPGVISFLDVITRIANVELYLEDIIINKDSKIIGKTLKDIRVPEKTGLIVIGIKKHPSKDIIFNPHPDEVFYQGDTLMVLGTESQVTRIRELANDNGIRGHSP